MHEATLYINFASVVPTAMWLQGQSKRAVASALVTPFQSYDVLLYTMPVAVPIIIIIIFLFLFFNRPRARAKSILHFYSIPTQVRCYQNPI